MATLDRTTVPMHDASKDRLRKFPIYTGPTSYATGGDSLTAAECQLGKIHFVSPEFATNGTAILCLRYDYTNAKMKWFDFAGNEIAAATNLSTYSARLEVIGQ